MEVERYSSNAIMLPGKKPKKKQMKKQVCDDVKAVSNAKLSKSHKRKLKRLEEEKDKATLLCQSIDTLEKCKLENEVYSLMWSSRNLSQVETVREKRQREVQFSKAGIKFPYNYQPLKKRAIDNSAHEVEQHIDRIEVECHELTHKRTEVPNNSFIYSLSTEDLNIRDDVGCPSGPAAEENIFTKKLSKPEYLQKSPSSCNGDDDDIGDFKGKVDDDKKVDHGITSVLVTSPPGKPLGSASTKEIEIVEACLDSSRLCANSLQAQGIVPKERTLVRPPLVHVNRPEEVKKQREKLPVVMDEHDIMDAIDKNKSVIICGETGCGKTTQVPQFLYEAGYGTKISSHPERGGLIGVTQPRRVAVLATAKRVAYELGLHLGNEVGFQVRHDKMIGDKSRIKFMTDGILLREIQNDFLLKRYSIIILDEAHERSLNTDILIGLLSRIVQERERQYQEQQKVDSGKYIINPENRIYPLKLVLMSATLRVEDFVSGRKIFHDPPFVIDVPTRQYPVTMHFAKRTDKVDYVGQAYKKVVSIHKRLPPGGVLVFLTGQREVKYLCQKLCKASKAMIENINEAFQSRGSSNCEITDRFGSYNGDYDDVSENESESSCDSEDGSDVELLKPDEDLLNQKSLDSDGHLENVLQEEGKAECEALAGKGTNNFGAGPMRVLPLYAMLPASEQLRVFDQVKEGERLVVVATNVAETSLTIPGIRYVVDTGREKVKKYNSSNSMEEYEIQWISKASAAQRAGRSGRTGPGHCYRLYSSAVFGNIFPKFSTAEILRVPVDGVVLLMKSMHIDKVSNFPFPTPPEATAIAEAERCLKVLGALNSEGRLTTLGEAMARYPMSPRHSRMLLTAILILRDVCNNGRRNLVLGHAVAAAAALSLPSPSTKEKDDDSGTVENRDEKSGKKTLKEFARANPASDVLTTAFALQCFELSTSPAEWCSDNALHLKTLEEMSKLRKQLLRLIFSLKMQSEFAWTHGGIDDVERAWRAPTEKYPLLEDEEKILRKAICAGWADRVAKRSSSTKGGTSQLSDGDRKVSNAVRYQACLANETVFLHRSSSVSRCAPEFLVYSELLCTKRPYIRGATKVEAKWMVEYAPSMCTFSSSHAEAAYDSEADEVCCRAIPIFGPHLWQLGCLRHNLPVKDDLKRVAVFAVALLEGRVLPCMRSKSSLLAVKAATIFRPELSGVKRAGNLLNKLLLLKQGRNVIDSREKLRQLWEDDPRELFAEIRDWYQQQFHDEFEELWGEMQHEILSLTTPP